VTRTRVGGAQTSREGLRPHGHARGGAPALREGWRRRGRARVARELGMKACGVATSRTCARTTAGSMEIPLLPQRPRDAARVLRRRVHCAHHAALGRLGAGKPPRIQRRPTAGRLPPASSWDSVRLQPQAAHYDAVFWALPGQEKCVPVPSRESEAAVGGRHGEAEGEGGRMEREMTCGTRSKGTLVLLPFALSYSVRKYNF